MFHVEHSPPSQYDPTRRGGLEPASLKKSLRPKIRIILLKDFAQL